jgi:hypothetical protein
MFWEKHIYKFPGEYCLNVGKQLQKFGMYFLKYLYIKLNTLFFLFFFNLYAFMYIFFYVESKSGISLWSLSLSEYREAMLSS